MTALPPNDTTVVVGATIQIDEDPASLTVKAKKAWAKVSDKPTWDGLTDATRSEIARQMFEFLLPQYFDDLS